MSQRGIIGEEDTLDAILKIWERSNFNKQIPQILVATYQQRNYLVADDSKSVFKLVSNAIKGGATYTVVRSKCVKSETKEDKQPIYSIHEKDALQFVCKGGIDDVATFVLRDIGPTYWSLETIRTPSMRNTSRASSIRRGPRSRRMAESDEELLSEEEGEEITPPSGRSRGRGTPARSTNQSTRSTGRSAASPTESNRSSISPSRRGLLSRATPIIEEGEEDISPPRAERTRINKETPRQISGRSATPSGQRTNTPNRQISGRSATPSGQRSTPSRQSEEIINVRQSADRSNTFTRQGSGKGNGRNEERDNGRNEEITNTRQGSGRGNEQTSGRDIRQNEEITNTRQGSGRNNTSSTRHNEEITNAKLVSGRVNTSSTNQNEEIINIETGSTSTRQRGERRETSETISLRQPEAITSRDSSRTATVNPRQIEPQQSSRRGSNSRSRQPEILSNSDSRRINNQRQPEKNKQDTEEIIIPTSQTARRNIPNQVPERKVTSSQTDIVPEKVTTFNNVPESMTSNRSVRTAEENPSNSRNNSNSRSRALQESEPIIRSQSNTRTLSATRTRVRDENPTSIIRGQNNISTLNKSSSNKSSSSPPGEDFSVKRSINFGRH